jgi:hypothetical protein
MGGSQAPRFQLVLARQSRLSTWPAAWPPAFMTAGNAGGALTLNTPEGIQDDARRDEEACHGDGRADN